MKRPILTVVLLLLAGCGPPKTVQDRQMRAEFGCLGRMADLLRDEGMGDVAGGDDPPLPTPEFRFVSTGQFVIDYGVLPLKPPRRLICTGDFNAGILTSVQIDGRIHRPGGGARWTF